MKISKFVRSNVSRLKPFVAERASFPISDDNVLLDANESPFDNDYNRYPDPYQVVLKEKLAAQKGLSPDQIFLGNGSDEIIDLIMRTFCTPREDIVRFIAPSFGMYEVAADINEVGKEIINLDHDFDIHVYSCLTNQTKKHKVLFLCSPNNPTGVSLSLKRMEFVIRGWNGIVVIDEAYIEFSNKPSFVSKIEEFNHLIVLQTFSKAQGGAGLRVGIAYTSPDIIKYLNRVKPPYNINLHSQRMAIEILSNQDKINKQIEIIKKERSIVREQLQSIDGVRTVFLSDANFLLVRCKRFLDLQKYLREHHIYVRDRSKLRACKSCLRMTIGTPAENQKLLKAVRAFYN